MMEDIANLLRYFAEVVEYGDTANSWLTLLPVSIQDASLALGEWMAALWY